MSTLEAIVGDWKAFLDIVFADLEALKIDVSQYELDHMCYRVQTDEQYAAAKAGLGALGTLLSTVVLGGRHISTYKLHEPVTYNGRSIALVELPEHKASSKNSYAVGLEHIEFAIGADKDLVEFTTLYPSISFDMSEITKANNPAVRIMLPNGHGSVKFHHLPLEEVIRIELSQAAQ